MSVTRVLLVPGPAYQDTLLADVTQAPPCVYQADEGHWVDPGSLTAWGTWDPNTSPCALPLAWGAALVAASLARLAWQQYQGDGDPEPDRSGVPVVAELPADLATAWEHAWQAQQDGVGTAYLLDDAGTDYTP